MKRFIAIHKGEQGLGALLGFVLLAHACASLWLSELRFFIPDEIVYYLMTQALAGGSLALDTGYAQFASPLFVFNMSSEHLGRVFAQYPLGYALLALPFFELLGKEGLFLINQLCFGVILWLVFRLQLALFGSRSSAWAALLITASGSFLWLYSQALAPHLLQITLLLAAALCVVCAQRARSFLLAGLLFGAALGVRLDSLFALPMLMIPLIFASPVKWRALALLLPGIALWLAVLSYSNHIKFGTYMPFSYDTQDAAGHANFKTEYVYLLLVALAGLAAAWCLARWRVGMRLIFALLAGAVLACSLLAGDWLLAFLYGFKVTVVDMSAIPLDNPISASASRTAGGGFMYLGEYKRALLQSAPFAALLGLLALSSKLALSRRECGWLCWLALVPAAFMGFFSLLNWHGGFAYHMRYYLPVLPFLAMIAAQLLIRFCAALGLSGRRLLWPVAIGCALAVGLVLLADGASEALREWMLLKLPLWLWPALLLAAALAFYDGAGRRLKQTAVMLCAFAVVWGGASSVLIVYPHLNAYKQRLHLMSSSYAHYLEPNSVVISVPRYFTSFFSSDQFQLYVATIYDDGAPVTLDHMRAMIMHVMQQGYSVYITHDMKSLPYIRKALPEWRMRLVALRPYDAYSDTPALSRFEKVK